VKLLADESVDWPIVERLRNDGHEVSYIAETDAGITDDVVLDLSGATNALLITGDKDFGELVFRQGKDHRGVALLRLDGLSNELKADIVATAVHEHGDEMEGAFSVIEPSIVRIRKRSRDE
jgi:predicted nuclease of predicted toxin-antitoxin system